MRVEGTVGLKDLQRPGTRYTPVTHPLHTLYTHLTHMCRDSPCVNST